MPEQTTQIEFPPGQLGLRLADCPTTKPCDAAGSAPAVEQYADSSALPQLKGYDVLVEVGRGGMGIVYKTLDHRHGGTVAVKVLAESLLPFPKARRRFVREARAAASVQHPHVVRILEVGPSEHRPYFVMEFLDGGSLHARLRRTSGCPALPIPTVLRLSEQIASGLAAAHAEGIVHRDIKPGNLLFVGGSDDIKITDFGIARVIEGDPTLRSSTSGSMLGALQPMGTPAYMSPEQSLGEELDYRSDLFSLGAVIFAMVTGRSPFERQHLAEVIEAVLQYQTPPLHTLVPEVPRSFSALVFQLLEKSRDRRVQSAAEVVQRLIAIR